MTLHPFCDSLAKSGDVPRAAACCYHKGHEVHEKEIG
jgi:hypothetical protein